jgi:hypothetical protein
VLPILSGALGLVLALALGVDPKTKLRGASLSQRLKALFLTTDKLLLLGAWVYALSAVAGIAVWVHKDTVTPALVTTVVLTVVGYAGATVTALARPEPPAGPE